MCTRTWPHPHVTRCTICNQAVDAEESAKYFLRIVEDQKYALDELQANVTLWKEMYKETQQVNIRGYVVSDPVEGR